MDSPTTEDGSPFGDIPTRPMRVKVLYTFDHDNKTNCLARFPDTLHIPAVAIDDNAQVGVIELRQCIQAIVAASPELLSRLAEGDFTIYAYDYSEYETPLVGQGMLSSALAASAPLVPAHQSKTMITGRVCQNVPALFAKGVKETLEVKLRLVPVPKQVQNEYVKSMESLRSNNPAMSTGFDPNAWNASLNIGNSQQTNTDYFQFDVGTPGSQQEHSLIDDMFGMGSGSGGDFSGQQALGGVGMSQTPSNALSGANPAFASHSHSAPGSRAGSPMMSLESNTFNEQLRHQSFSTAPPNFGDQSRPGSRASVRSESFTPSHSHHTRPRQLSTHSVDLTQQNETFFGEDGQPRKRAKVTQADWHGKSSFGGRSADLRVTAATAASMQMHRPVPTRPCAPGSNLEPPPRVPTPTPQIGLPANQRPRIPSARSMLRQASTAGSDFMSDADQMFEAVVSSPEDITPDNSVAAGETPQEFPSSPPLFPGLNEPTPSSPGLPTLSAPQMADSGYMSERNMNSSTYPGNFETDARSPEDDYSTAGQYQRRKQQRKTRIKSEGLEAAKMPPPYPSDAPTSELNFEWEQPGDMNQLPQKMLLNLPPGRGGERPASSKRAASRTNSPAPRSMTPVPGANESGLGNARASSRAPSLAPAAALNTRMTPVPGSAPPESRRGSLALPTKRPPPCDESVDASAPPAKKRQTTKRARSAHPDSEAGSPAPSDTEGRPAGPNRSGSGAQRRKIIEQRMHDAVAKGEMPQYCVHCGAIETPTWRRLYFKIVEGKPGPLDSVEDEGETIAVAPLEWDEAGEVSKFIIRKSMKKAGKDAAGPGFEEVIICNPCGLWFKKNRDMRPKDKWGKKSGPRKSRKNRMGEIGIATDSVEPESEAFFTDGIMPEDSTSEAIFEAPQAITHLDAQHMPSKRPRSHSMQAQQRMESTAQWDSNQLDAALQRAIQSSPGRFQGSQDSPIEIEELTPRPTRRMLFPSPRKDGQVKAVDDKSSSDKTSSPTESDMQKLMSATVGQNDVAIFDVLAFDKENMPPPFDDDDELAHLFDGSPTSHFRTPGKTPRKTPPKSSQPSIDQLLKTPTPASRKRRLLTPSAAAANNANQQNPAAGNDFMTSPGSSRYFLRSTPTRLANTPGRRSALGSDTSNQASPFSRHLSQLLNNATGGSGDCFTSPNGGLGGLDFDNLPTFTTPGRWEGLMGSDFGVFEDGQA